MQAVQKLFLWRTGENSFVNIILFFDIPGSPSTYISSIHILKCTGPSSFSSPPCGCHQMFFTTIIDDNNDNNINHPPLSNTPMSPL